MADLLSKRLDEPVAEQFSAAPLAQPLKAAKENPIPAVINRITAEVDNLEDKQKAHVFVVLNFQTCTQNNTTSRP